MAENKAFEGEDGVPVPPYPAPKELDVHEGHQGLPEQSQSFRQVLMTFPKSVFFIVGNEFCERFSYYGFRTVLTLYFLNVLGLADKDAVAGFHAFTVVAYFTPILGSILADGYIGKFHTILWVSLLYASGNIILAISATFPQGNGVHPAMDIIGLLVIAIGTGGIKPCVSAFGGDQFQKGQEKALEYFFSVFYFCINAGSTIAVLITPIFREKSCTVFGYYSDSCFALCFGVPAVLMICACLFFIFGSFWYKRYPPKENIFIEFFKVITTALINRSRFSMKREHWLDHYLDDHSCEWDDKCRNSKECAKVQFVEDVKAVLRILVLYLPTPFFWALYDQQGSRWLIQGTQMDGRLGSAQVLPDQLQVANPVLIMMFIPIFSGIVYPLASKCFKITPLRKMTAGGLLAVVAYVITAIIQFQINPTLPYVPTKGETSVLFMNLMPCNVEASLQLDGHKLMQHNLTAYAGGNAEADKYQFLHIPDGNYSWALIPDDPQNPHCSLERGYQVFKAKTAYYVTAYRTASENFVVASEADMKKPENGFGEYKLSFNMLIPGYTNATGMMCALPKHKTPEYCFTHDLQRDQKRFRKFEWSSGETVASDAYRPYDHWLLFLPETPAGVALDNVTYWQSFNITSQGAIYTINVFGEDPRDRNTWDIERTELVSPNKVNIMLQLPQFIVITAAEILFSITGLELSYSQAPNSMKSLLQGVWLLCIAIGDCIVLIVVETDHFPNQAWEFILFAGVMLVVMVIFACIAQFWYTYVYYIHEDDDDEEKEEEKKAVP